MAETGKARDKRRLPSPPAPLPGTGEGRRAFTLVEILVVVAIIGVLIGLLIAAVQSAREAGRRVSCQSNIRQIALAVTEFHDENGHFPQGQCDGTFGFGPDGRTWSWMARILPYVEEKSIYQNGTVLSQTLSQSGIAQSQVRLFLCPSDGYTWAGPRIDAGNLAGFAVGQTNYKAVSGANWGADASQGLGPLPPAPLPAGQPGVDYIGTLWPNPGTNGSEDGLENGDGLMWRSDYRQPVRAQDVTDGLSHTFLLGEDLPQKNNWCSWPYANNAYGTCAIPPNYTSDDPSWWPNTHSFRSAHPRGLNFSMADASTRFVADDIDLSVYRALATRAGGEPPGDF